MKMGQVEIIDDLQLAVAKFIKAEAVFRLSHLCYQKSPHENFSECFNSLVLCLTGKKNHQNAARLLGLPIDKWAGRDPVEVEVFSFTDDSFEQVVSFFLISQFLLCYKPIRVADDELKLFDLCLEANAEMRKKLTGQPNLREAARSLGCAVSYWEKKCQEKWGKAIVDYP